MSVPIHAIVKLLDTQGDPALRSLADALAECRKPAKADELLQDIQCKEDEIGTDVRAQDKSPYCSTFYAAVYSVKQDYATSLEYLQEARRGFNCRAERRNFALVTWMQALTLKAMGQVERARLDFERAQATLKTLSDEHLRVSQYEQAQECSKLIERIKSSIQAASAKPAASAARAKPEPAKPAGAPAASPKKTKANFASLLFPVYDPVSAGRARDFIFDSEPQDYVSISELTIKNKPYKVHNLRGREPVTLPPRVYRWMFVEGDSMNEARPTPLATGDCLLVVETDSSGLSPKTGDIVVAALLDPASTAEQAGVVKRYTAGGLRSESSNTYPLISHKKARVKGIVLAVAKPIE